MSLRDYKSKRNFELTPEPAADYPVVGKKNRFVIQKHAASHLHYDFRLELGGTLKSWAVPKGLPLKKGEKHLAIQVEDHPLSYINFEGTIPEGQYGAGTVMVWDYGNFEALGRNNALRQLSSGKLHFKLTGKKLAGEWYLVESKKEDHQWLLIKSGQDSKAISKKLADRSAISGSSIKEIARVNSIYKASRQAVDPIVIENKSTTTKKDILQSPRFIEPMKAKLVLTPPRPNKDWNYEIKFDGFRTIALKNDAEITLLSRNKKNFNIRFPEIVKSVAKIKARTIVIDGEICAVDKQGISSFELLQDQNFKKSEAAQLIFYVFDLLYLNGESLQATFFEDRRSKLAKIINQTAAENIKFSSSLYGSPQALLKKARQFGLEGLIGKKRNSLYEAGKRSGSWIKLKLNKEQEFIIGGYSKPAGSRSSFGALLVGYYKGKKLHFAGKVGSGFSEKLLKDLALRFSRLRSAESPFFNFPQKNTNSSRAASQRKIATYTWLRPELLCQLKFSEWTRDGKLRHPVYLGLREDKSASEVVREIAAPI